MCVQGDKLKIHANPKRFPAAVSTDWRARVLHQDDVILVVDKPGGVPVMAHESNSSQTVPVSPPASLLSQSIFADYGTFWVPNIFNLARPHQHNPHHDHSIPLCQIHLLHPHQRHINFFVAVNNTIAGTIAITVTIAVAAQFDSGVVQETDAGCGWGQRCLEGALGGEGLHLVHRLDLWTTGVLLLARSLPTATAFMTDLASPDRPVRKEYKA